MISVMKFSRGIELSIGGHVISMSQHEALQLAELIQSEEHGTFGPWRREQAGAYDHPWESRCRIILHHGNRKWHFTLSELEGMLDQLGDYLEL